MDVIYDESDFLPYSGSCSLIATPLAVYLLSFLVAWKIYGARS